MTATEHAAPVAATNLAPYVPRIVVGWLRDEPGAKFQAVEGTLAFVDISGFTALAEKLSALGKVRAEEGTEVINATFSRLLDVAYANGGGVRNVGVDAPLPPVSAARHTARARRAASRMRQAPAEAGET